MPRLVSTLRNHLPFIVVVGILTAVLTWPAVENVFDTSVFWLPTSTDSADVWMKLWDAWYFKSLIAGRADFYFTDLLFYPDGLSLVYHNFNVPHMVVFGGLQAVVPTSNAFNLTYLLIIFSTALSAYAYLYYLLKNKWAGLFGAVVLGLSGYVVGRASQPDVAWIATLPLALYFFHRAIDEKRWLFIGISGILAGLTAFIGMYTYVCILLTLGLYILCFARSRWRTRHFWMRIALLFFVIGAISIVRIYPMIADSRGLEDALNKSGGRERENDLLQYFINYEHPIVNELIATGAVQFEKPGGWNTSYLGYVPLLLIGLGLRRGRYRRRMLPWLMLIAPFLLLRLGSVLTINGLQTGILLPKHYLDKAFPAVFEAFHAPDLFQAGALLPLAVLSCYGLMAVLRSVSAQHRPRIILICIALVAFEYYRLPEGKIVTDEETAFLDWLRLEEDQDSIRLINLPMDRINSKRYLFHQTLSGYPQVEGLASRTPPQAYQYIKNNQLLKAWRANSSIQCTLSNQGEYLLALNDLADDRFSHIVFHHTLDYAEYLAGSFLDVLPSYEDEFTSIYRLEDLRGICVDLIVQNYGLALREFTDTQSPFAVLYDSGILFANLLYEVNSDQMTFYFWWHHDVEYDYAFSIQIFNGQGERVQQYDDAIAREPSFAVYDVDISMLAEGSYTAKLIVYDFVTRVSQPGTVLNHQERFERELEIAAFTIRDGRD